VSAFSIPAAVLVGVVATLALDVVAGCGIATGMFRMPAFGRWFLYLLRGKVRHDDIETSPAIRGEGPLTFPLHYLAGMGLAGVYLLLLDGMNLGRGTFLLAVLYGVATSLIPLFVMLPSMGYGLLGLRGRGRTFWLQEILVMHLAYGAGIGLGVNLFVSG
jgi:hypothetical protein